MYPCKKAYLKLVDYNNSRFLFKQRIKNNTNNNLLNKILFLIYQNRHLELDYCISKLVSPTTSIKDDTTTKITPSILIATKKFDINQDIYPCSEDEGKTLLYYAIQKRMLYCVTILLRYGADPQIIYKKKGKSSFQKACDMRDTQIILTLLFHMKQKGLSLTEQEQKSFEAYESKLKAKDFVSYTVNLKRLPEGDMIPSSSSVI